MRSQTAEASGLAPSRGLGCIALAIALLALQSTIEAAPPQLPTTASVTVELLADGRCAISSTGNGFRSRATYKPNVATADGSHRCAMPPVSQSARINLSVKLPTGAAKPGASVPPLVWSRDSGRWTGTAELVKWPETIVVSSSSPNWLALGLVGALVVLMTAVLWRRQLRGPGHIARMGH